MGNVSGVTGAKLLEELLAAERLANARRVNVVRCWGISFFFALFLTLGGIMGIRSWQGNLAEFGVYWAATLAVYAASRRFAAIERNAALSIALLDIPMVLLLQWKQFPTSPNAGAIAGYNLGIYVFLVILAALSLDARIIYATAFFAAVGEGVLQYLASISPGAIVATFAIMALTGVACAYASRRLVRLIAELGADMTARFEIERAAEHDRTRLAGLSREMEIASQIQVSILPRAPIIRGFAVAASMKPAEKVGGDYYDVLPASDGAWVGIGDVSGHGVTAGLEMMMLQTAIASQADDGRTPESVLVRANRVMYENIRHRLGTRDHVTCSLLRLHEDGRVVFAGAHEPIVWRHASGACELVETPGTWLGLARDIRHATKSTELALLPGDLLVLHTDGLSEAANDSGARFGVERLQELVSAAPSTRPADIVAMLEAAVAQWSSRQHDDITIVALRREPS